MLSSVHTILDIQVVISISYFKLSKANEELSFIQIYLKIF